MAFRTVNESYYRFAPAAGVNASAIDLGYWLIAQLGYNPDVLNEDQLKQITSKRVRTVRDLRRRLWREHITDAHYALGWRVYQFGQEQLVYHGGWVQGFRAELAYSKERELGLVILLNAESNVVAELSTYFWSTMFTAMQDTRQSSPVSRLQATCNLRQQRLLSADINQSKNHTVSRAYC
ncbi:serine hydrolase [Alishewanella longhuensis]